MQAATDSVARSRARIRLLGFDLGPTVEEVTDQPGADILEPVQDLREIAFQEGREAIAHPRPIIDQAPSLLYQET